ncbi:type VII secretion system-associated protein [Streptomyces sp. TLI_171]|uniref:type VII secretion system-associated protein n=1 Tax=Streptomyces sp. TLI_171 TaxID=1938859 RepID=UPI000E73C716|nr:type VII secretion system-associated protein [Streptomyces sp. TLI_171]RKE22125.1 hypothetical protein BX266_5552 [Streptomyces sp. TLI_171]
MATDADLTSLDQGALQTFINGPLTQFIEYVVAARRESGGNLSVGDIAQGYTNASNVSLAKPLALGLMAGSDAVHGQALNSGTVTAAKLLDNIFASEDQQFERIKQGLLDLIKDFLEHQGSNLDSISAEELLNHITVTPTAGPTVNPLASTSTST